MSIPAPNAVRSTRLGPLILAFLKALQSVLVLDFTILYLGSEESN